MTPLPLLLSLLLLVLCSCSPPQDEEESQSSIKKAAIERGHEAARQIKQPIEQAELTKQIQADRDQKIKEMIDQQ